jgi:hypothetical protein
MRIAMAVTLAAAIGAAAAPGRAQGTADPTGGGVAQATADENARHELALRNIESNYKKENERHDQLVGAIEANPRIIDKEDALDKEEQRHEAELIANNDAKHKEEALHAEKLAQINGENAVAGAPKGTPQPSGTAGQGTDPSQPSPVLKGVATRTDAPPPVPIPSYPDPKFTPSGASPVFPLGANASGGVGSTPSGPGDHWLGGQYRGFDIYVNVGGAAPGQSYTASLPRLSRNSNSPFVRAAGTYDGTGFTVTQLQTSSGQWLPVQPPLYIHQSMQPH